MRVLEQDTLFGPKLISTINYNETNLINDILHLHSKEKVIDCDPTYSVGNFYKNLPKPKHRFDKDPKINGVHKATSDNIPLGNESINTIMFDPPFVIGGSYESNPNSKKGSCIIGKRFTNFETFEELKLMYGNSLKEFHRILKPNGIVIFKNQDSVSGGLNLFSHCWIFNKSLEIGFYPKDLFLLLSKSRMYDNRKQQHARKFHSYYWVLVKQKCNVNYACS